MKASPAFQFYVKDFLVGTGEMSGEEVGAYIRLLCYQWDNGSLPNDIARLAALCGCSGNAVASIRHKFGIGPDDRLRNARLEREREKQNNFRVKQAIKCEKRWEGKRKNAAAYPTAQPTALPEPKQRECPSSSTSVEDIKGEKAKWWPETFRESEEFHRKWEQWEDYSKDNGKTMLPATRMVQLTQLERASDADIFTAISMILRSIQNGWKNLNMDPIQMPKQHSQKFPAINKDATAKPMFTAETAPAQIDVRSALETWEAK